MATIASLNIALTADSARLRRDLDRAGRTTQTWSDRQRGRFSAVARSARGLNVAIAGISTAMGVSRLIDNADALAKNADAAGMTVEAYQRLRHGLGQAGISQAGFEKGLRTFSKIFADAGEGVSTATDALGAIGMTFEDLESLAPEERFLAVADAVSQIEDASLRTAAGAELLGREFGAVNIDVDAVIADGESIAVVTEDAASSAEDMKDAMSQLSETMTSIMTNVFIPFVANLVPVFESLANFAEDNPEFASVLAGLGALGVAFTILGGPLTIVTAAVAAAILVWQNWDTIIGTLTEKWDTFGDNFPTVAAAIEDTVNTLLAPFVILKDIITEVFDLFTGEGDFLERLKTFSTNIVASLYANNPIVALTESLADLLKVPLNAVIRVFEGLINNAIDSINELTSFSIEIPFYGTYTVEGTSISPLELPAFASGGHVSGPGTGTSDSIPALLSNGEFVMTAAATRSYGPALEAMNSGKIGAFANGGAVGGGSAGGGTASGQKESVYDRMANSLVGKLETSFSSALKTGDWKGFFNTMLDSLTSGIIDAFMEGMMAPIRDGLSDMIGGIFESAGGAGGGLGGIFSGIGSWFGGLFGAAEGGIVPTTPFSRSYADSVPTMLQPGELVVPVDQVDNFMGGGGGSQVFNINVTGDVSRLTRSEIVKMMPQIAAGTNMLNKEAGIR